MHTGSNRLGEGEGVERRHAAERLTCLRMSCVRRRIRQDGRNHLDDRARCERRCVATWPHPTTRTGRRKARRSCLARQAVLHSVHVQHVGSHKARRPQLYSPSGARAVFCLLCTMCHRPLIPSAFPDGDKSAGETLGELSIGDLRPSETKRPNNRQFMIPAQ